MHQDPLWTTQEAVWRGHGPSHTSVGHTGNTHHGRSTVGQERTLRPLGLLAGVASSTGPVLGAQEAAALTPHTYLKATDTVHITGFMPYLPYRVGRHLPHNTLPIPFPRNTHTHTHTHTFLSLPKNTFPHCFQRDREKGGKRERNMGAREAPTGWLLYAPRRDRAHNLGVGRDQERTCELPATGRGSDHLNCAGQDSRNVSDQAAL